MGIHGRFSGLGVNFYQISLSLSLSLMLLLLWQAVPLYFPNLSFPIQILHYIGYSLFLFPSKTIPFSRGWLTAVCACIIISFTAAVCSRSLWQTSILQYYRHLYLPPSPPPSGFFGPLQVSCKLLWSSGTQVNQAYGAVHGRVKSSALGLTRCSG